MTTLDSCVRLCTGEETRCPQRCAEDIDTFRRVIHGYSDLEAATVLTLQILDFYAALLASTAHPTLRCTRRVLNSKKSGDTLHIMAKDVFVCERNSSTSASH